MLLLSPIPCPVCLFPNSLLSVFLMTDSCFSFQVEKIVFVVFFSGEQARTKILKICDAFGANCYPVPEDISKQRQITSEVHMPRLRTFFPLWIIHTNVSYDRSQVYSSFYTKLFAVTVSVGENCLKFNIVILFRSHISYKYIIYYD